MSPTNGLSVEPAGPVELAPGTWDAPPVRLPGLASGGGVATEAPPAPAPHAAAPIAVRLITLAGESSAPELHLQFDSLHIGRGSEVIDADGRTVRRNGLFFPDDPADTVPPTVNATVSRSHAHLLLDATVHMRMAAYGTGVESPSVLGLKRDLDRLRQEMDQFVREAKKGAEDFIREVKKLREELAREEAAAAAAEANGEGT